MKRRAGGDREGPIGVETKGTRGGQVRDGIRKRHVKMTQTEKNSEIQIGQERVTEKSKGK